MEDNATQALEQVSRAMTGLLPLLIPLVLLLGVLGVVLQLMTGNGPLGAIIAGSNELVQELSKHENRQAIALLIKHNILEWGSAICGLGLALILLAATQ